MVKPDPVLYWLEELFGNLVGAGSFVALNGNAFDIYGLPDNMVPRCGTVLESETDTSGSGKVTHYLLQLDDSVEAEIHVATPPQGARQENLVRGVIRFATQGWRMRHAS